MRKLRPQLIAFVVSDIVAFTWVRLPGSVALNYHVAIGVFFSLAVFASSIWLLIGIWQNRRDIPY
ncbi:MAG: hypothetical protein JO322_02330 [Candidatus Eremiobacteraeota bacterium]|nr:hypothetical protein [Candidatus Eremiobacteraeota bacterium]